MSPNPAHALDSVWRSGRLSARPGPKELLFGRVYEDSTVERGAFSPGGRIFCIASGGCTALALCREHEVVACDVNPAQIDYVRRRLAGGARELGRADRIVRFLRALMPLAGWGAERLDAFLSLEDPERQCSVFREELDTRRLRLGLWLLTSPLWLRTWYSSALLASLPARFDRVLRRRLERCITLHPNRNNPYLHALLRDPDTDTDTNTDTNTDETDPNVVSSPPELVTSDAATYLEACPARSFSGFSLSNVLDGAEPAYVARLTAAVRRAARPNAQVVLRSFREPPADLAGNRAADDRTPLWGIVDVRAVETLAARPFE